MKNYTHVIANFLVNRMNEYRMYSESEKIVITYGIEIIFNNILKVMIYLTVGFVCNIFLETLLAIFILVILRVVTGGCHFQSDFVCTLLSGVMIFLPIIFSIYVTIGRKSFEVLLLGTAIVYFVFAPQDKKYEEASKIELLSVKIGITVFLVVSCLSSLVINKPLGIIVLCVSFLQGLSLILGGKYSD
ncbi:MAG: hypothetical protein HFG88_13730 [Dorea sp.]|nr:hypothetical protein [Dorea sp.]